MALVRLFQSINLRDLSQRAAEIAVSASAQVRDLAVERARDMERAEARGYIRAKSTPIIAAHLAAFHRQQPQTTVAELNWLRVDIADRVVRLVLDDAVRAKVLTTRRAA